MDKRKIKDFTRGWFIGAFESSLLDTKEFEVGLIPCSKGIHEKHYHKIATEINVLVRGKLKINNEVINEGDIYIIYPNESTEQEFLVDSIVLCVKTPAIPNDKYLD
jgi:hypothetical protein